ncbi:uncharacterized protein BDZ99DRAFT_514165 [Mytilinidion resinicola]|uniref:Uncharacterized protein n=1 Tax=Mytilinidion resinicola TaxID=574789 RepID=A0A6A6ZCB1_9PEZI|nr:uncharacterized protein BDZ99DRAFT_514165 [Mytilinidion resinicola]KAF2817945.1 hypothetical protein BDZ99DRAFT_514165 [Mytilinidion resinicola]
MTPEELKKHDAELAEMWAKRERIVAEMALRTTLLAAHAQDARRALGRAVAKETLAAALLVPEKTAAAAKETATAATATKETSAAAATASKK